MKNSILGFLFIAISTLTFAQEDPQSKKILSELSKATKAYSGISADFTSILENKQAELKVTQAGKLLLKGDMYSLDLEDFKVISNGTTNWTIAKEDQEVIIENTKDLMDENGIDPSSIFTIWEDGFRHKFDGQQMVGKQNCNVVKLFPIDPKSRNFHTLVLYILADKQEIKKVKVLGKSGEEYTYLVDNFKGNVSISDSEFNFDTKANPNMYVIDNR